MPEAVSLGDGARVPLLAGTLENICSPDQRTARPSSTLTPLPSPQQTKLIVLAGPVGAGRVASRRPQAGVPPARAPPDTQGIVPQSTAPGHLGPAPGPPPTPLAACYCARPSQLGARGSQLMTSPPSHPPAAP